MKAKGSSKGRRWSSKGRLLTPDIISTLPQTIIEESCVFYRSMRQQGQVSSQVNGGTNGPQFLNSCLRSVSSEAIFAVLYANFCCYVMIQYTSSALSWTTILNMIISNLILIKYYSICRRIMHSSVLTLDVFESNSYNLLSCVCNGFRSLTSLSLGFVTMHSETLLQFLSNCPSLKNLSLFMCYEDFLGDKLPTMAELFKCLPVIERLTIFGDIAVLLVPDLVMQELPTSLIHLKYFCVEQLQFFDGKEMTFLAVLFKCSPNLEKIEIEMYDGDEEIEGNIPEEYSDVWLEHLLELKIKYYYNSEPELEFVKFILARSPKLKKVSIHSCVDKDQEPEMLKTLKRIPRASPVEIDVF